MRGAGAGQERLWTVRVAVVWCRPWFLAGRGSLLAVVRFWLWFGAGPRSTAFGTASMCGGGPRCLRPAAACGYRRRVHRSSWSGGESAGQRAENGRDHAEKEECG